MPNKRIHIEKKTKYFPRQVQWSKIKKREGERASKRKGKRAGINIYMGKVLWFLVLFSCFVSLAYRFRLFTFLLSTCDRFERRFLTELKSLNEQNKTFVQIYSQFKCINMSPIVEQYKIKSTTKKEQSSRITFLDLNLFNYSF